MHNASTEISVQSHRKAKGARTFNDGVMRSLFVPSSDCL
jgi:hypothetical protein